MAGTMVAEFPSISISDKYSLSNEKIMEIAKEMFGDGAEEVLEAYKKAIPTSILLMYSIWILGSGFWLTSI